MLSVLWKLLQCKVNNTLTKEAKYILYDYIYIYPLIE